MKIKFNQRDNGPERLLAEAEIAFDEGLLAGCKVVGSFVWRGADDVARVTLPARAFGTGSDRRYFDLLRSDTDNSAPVKAVKAAILEAFEEWCSLEPETN